MNISNINYKQMLKPKKIFNLLNIGIISMVILIGILSFQKDDNLDNMDNIKKLYETFQHGKIVACKFKGERVYYAHLSCRDCSTIIFNKNGKHIGTCNYSWIKRIDSICNQITDCKVIYRVENNIWGDSPVDKYGLKN